MFDTLEQVQTDGENRSQLNRILPLLLRMVYSNSLYSSLYHLNFNEIYYTSSLNDTKTVDPTFPRYQVQTVK